MIDTASNRVVATVEVGKVPGGLALTPDGKYAYVANYNEGIRWHGLGDRHGQRQGGGHSAGGGRPVGCGDCSAAEPVTRPALAFTVTSGRVRSAPPHGIPAAPVPSDVWRRLANVHGALRRGHAASPSNWLRKFLVPAEWPLQVFALTFIMFFVTTNGIQ